MNDRELLELAAKAASIGLHEWQDGMQPGFLLFYEPRLWNPLADDGDALRLAVKLRIRIAGMDQRACAFIGLKEFWEPEGDDPCAATRRAITRAAAALAVSDLAKMEGAK